jgi:hypothetical protein
MDETLYQSLSHEYEFIANEPLVADILWCGEIMEMVKIAVDCDPTMDSSAYNEHIVVTRTAEVIAVLTHGRKVFRHGD